MKVERAQVQNLIESGSGQVVLEGDDGYDQARAVWNGMIDRRPAVIVRCASSGDVVAALGFAREHGLEVSTRGGGHNVAGRAVVEDGLMLDLSLMNGVEVDPELRRAYVQPGARWADVDRETQAHGLATTGGLDSRTGVAGLTLGGGLGYLARTYGLAADNLVAAEVVTAAGEVVRASEDSNADLLWALRGGGGGFGVVTSFEFRLHEVGPEVAVGQAYILREHAAEALTFYREFTETAPDEVACYALALRIPPVDPFPAEHHGEVAIGIVAMHCGSVESGEDALAPLAALDNAILSFVAPMPYAVLQSSFDAGAPDGGRYYYKSEYLSALPDEAIDAIVGQLDPFPGDFTMVGLEPLGGAINRVARDATAFPHRDSALVASVWGGWSDPADDEQMIAWSRGVHAAIAPYSNGGTYANYLDHDDSDRIDAAFGGNYERLLDVKRTWDPDNLFGANQFITLSG